MLQCYTMLQFCKKGCHLGQMLVNWMIWEMILPEEKGNFTVSDSWVRPFPQRFQCHVVFLLRLIWTCCSDHGTSAVPSSTSSTMTAGVCESLAGCCVEVLGKSSVKNRSPVQVENNWHLVLTVFYSCLSGFLNLQSLVFLNVFDKTNPHSSFMSRFFLLSTWGTKNVVAENTFLNFSLLQDHGCLNAHRDRGAPWSLKQWRHCGMGYRSGMCTFFFHSKGFCRSGSNSSVFP